MKKIILILLIISACNKPSTITPSSSIVNKSYLIKTVAGGNKTYFNLVQQATYTDNFEVQKQINYGDTLQIKVYGDYPSLQIYDNGNLIVNSKLTGTNQTLIYTIR